MLVEEIPRGSDPNVYFSSSINLKASKSMYSSSNNDSTRKRLAAGSYNLNQLEAHAHDASLNESLIETRKSVKRHQELDRENYSVTEQQQNHQNKIELPRSGLNVDFKNFSSSQHPIFDLLTYASSVNKNSGTSRVRSGQTPSTRKVLQSRKTLNNYLDEDPQHSQFLKASSKIYSNTSSGSQRVTYPGKKLCSICGSNAPNRCVRCGVRFCSVKCLGIHKETRCANY